MKKIALIILLLVSTSVTATWVPIDKVVLATMAVGSTGITGGANKQVLFNDGGVLGGDNSLLFTKALGSTVGAIGLNLTPVGTGTVQIGLKVTGTGMDGSSPTYFTVLDTSGTSTFRVGSTGVVMGSSTTPLTLFNSTQAGASKALTESNATAFVKISVSDLAVAGGFIEYSIRAVDATDSTAISGVVAFSAVAKSGTVTCTVSSPTETAVATSAGGATLSNTFTCADGGSNTVSILANAVSSLTQTTLQINYLVHVSSGLATVTLQ